MIEEIQLSEQTKTIRFENRKSRGDVDKTATFVYSNQKVANYQELLDSVRTISDDDAEALAKIHQVNSRLVSNKEVMDQIKAEIEAGNTNKTELINSVNKSTLVSKSKVKRVLDDHTGTIYKSGHRWNFSVKDKNCHIYSLIDHDSEESYRRQM
jgi:ABC-type Fe3+-citrate transport system substrate-binding protein